ncbi:MAG: hypothetical protein MUP28_02525 [Candidatus Aminicenantes bacterium]|nr:hypothetical protein [Candidatus Aminicenantes bacterium]
MRDFLGLGLQPGDVIVIWSSRLIGFMVNAVFGIHDPATHVEMVYDDGFYNISSDIGGVKLRPTARLFKCRKWVVLRNKKVSALRVGQIQGEAVKYLGRGYDYALYALWVARVSLVLQPLVWLMFQPFRNWLKREEAKRFTCSELVVQILKDLGVDTGIDEPHNAPPDNLLQAARACVHDWSFIAGGGRL